MGQRRAERHGKADLIAKKDVLERTGISYGQFYRWKRKGLIPERWFTRKSTHTGQETFLPRELILERIATVQALKTEHSLEEISELLVPEPSQRTFPATELRTRGWVRSATLDCYVSLTGETGPFGFRDLVLMAAWEALSHETTLTRDEAGRAVLAAWHSPFAFGADGPDGTLWLLRSGEGEPIGCVTRGDEVAFDPGVRVRAHLPIQPIAERLRHEVHRNRKETV